EHADHGRPDAGTNRIGAERRPDRALFQVLDAGRQSTGTQSHRKVLSLLLGEPAVDDAVVTNGVFDHRHFLHLVVENDRQVVAHMSGSEGVELAPTLTGKDKADRRLAIFVGARFRSTKIATGDGRGPRDYVPGFAGFGVA